MKFEYYVIIALSIFLVFLFFKQIRTRHYSELLKERNKKLQAEMEVIRMDNRVLEAEKLKFHLIFT